MGVINKTTEKINELLDKVEQGGSIQVEWNDVINKPTWVTSSTKPSYTASEVGAIPTGGLKTINGQSLEGSGNIEISGSGSGIPDAPADNEIYGRKNNNWEKIITSGMQIFDTTELAGLVDAGESDLSPTLKEAIVFAYENKTAFADVDGTLYLLIITTKSEGYDLIIYNYMPYSNYGLYYVSINADVNTATNRIAVTLNGMILPSNTQVPSEAPTDGKTYGRNNKKWVEITSSGGGSGSVQIVDISDLYEKYFTNGVGDFTGAMSQEDYNLLENYGNNKDVICVVRKPIGATVNILVYILVDTTGIIIFFYDLFYALLPMPCSYTVTKSDLSYTAQRQAYLTSLGMSERNMYLSKYVKKDTYTPITTSDSVLEALGKLEAAVNELQKQ